MQNYTACLPDFTEGAELVTACQSEVLALDYSSSRVERDLEVCTAMAMGGVAVPSASPRVR